MRVTGLLTGACALSALLCSAAGAAEEAGEQEIIVYADKRESRLQDVPIAVSVIGADALAASGARDLQDIAALAPALQFNVSENETSATARLRGIGTQGSNPGLESAVGVFVDGVYRARNGVALGDLGPVEQVEVLRGPQGTLYGRNTSAGLISVRTRGPDFGAKSLMAEAQIGYYDQKRLSFDLNAPFSSDLAARFYAARDVRDGFIEVVDETGALGDANNRDLWTLRAQLGWRPGANLDMRLIVDWSKRDEECCAGQFYDPSIINGAPFSFPASTTRSVAAQGGFGPGSTEEALARLGDGSFGVRRAFIDRAYQQQIEDGGLSLEINWDLGGATVTSVSAYRNWTFDQGQDGDFTALDLRIRPFDGESGFGFETATQELRLSGVAGPLDWLAGVYVASEHLERRDGQGEGAGFGPYVVSLAGSRMQRLADALGGVDRRTHDRYAQDGLSLAIFTHNIFALDDKTDLTIGLRYTKDEKDLAARFRTDISSAAALAAQADAEGLAAFGSCDITAVPASAGDRATITSLRTFYCLADFRTELDGPERRQSLEEGEWSGIVALHRDLTNQISAYASYSRGYKASGFNLDRDFSGVAYLGLTPSSVAYKSSFAPEFVDAYEIGAKTAWFSGDLVLNAAIFHYDIENYQLNTYNGLNFQVASIPEAKSDGAELDYYWRTPLAGLTLQGGVAYAEAEYGDDAAWVAQTANPITGALTNFRLPGSRLTNAPLWTVVNAARYERPVSAGLKALAAIDARYVSSQNTGSNLAATKVQPGYTVVNGRIGLATLDDRWAIEVWGRNLFDEEYAQIMFDAPLQPGALGAFLGDPRTLGLTLRARY